MSFDPRAFFDAYRTAFAGFDSAAICKFYHYPNMIVSNDTTAATADEATMTGHVGRLLNFYKERGAIDPRIQSLLPTELSPWLCQVSVAWRLFNAEDHPMVHFHTTYTVRKTGDTWRIVFVIAHDEKQAFERAVEEQMSISLPRLSSVIIDDG